MTNSNISNSGLSINIDAKWISKFKNKYEKVDQNAFVNNLCNQVFNEYDGKYNILVYNIGLKDTSASLETPFGFVKYFSVSAHKTMFGVYVFSEGCFTNMDQLERDNWCAYGNFQRFNFDGITRNELNDVNCVFHRLSNIAEHTLGKIDRITGRIADTISDTWRDDRLGRYLSNDGKIAQIYQKHRQKYRDRLEKLCEFFRRGKLYKAPCHLQNDDKPKQLEPKPGYDEEKDKIIASNPTPVQGNVDKITYGNPCKTKEGAEGYCQPPAYCFSQFIDIDDYLANRCPLTNGVQGICCSKVSRAPDQNNLPIRIPHPYRPSAKIRFISLEDINRAAEESQKVVRKFVKTEKELISKGYFQRRGSSQSQHQAFFGQFDPHQFQLTKGGFINLQTTIRIKERFKLTNDEARDGLIKYSLENTDLEKYCIEEPDCKQSKYRTADGSCNNLQRPLWGRSNTAFSRLVPPAYADGLDEPRISVTGEELPGARVVSSAAATEHNLNDKKFTLMVMQWGQFIDHDLTLSASTRAATGQGLICCNEESDTEIMHPACNPIPIPENDRFYSKHRQTCMNFVRNAPSPRPNCALGHREQMNTLTHTIDGSMVYGSTTETMKHLRSFKGGKLRISTINNVEFLPFDTANRSDECAIPERDRSRIQCFVGGDVRVNEQTGLTMIHNLLLREHNRIANILQKLNPEWHDEIVYQESRRIVAAEIQHIAYNEWTPLILGRSVMNEFNILPKSYGFSDDYDPKINPNIINSFATAAYRFHTLIQGFIELMNNAGQVTQKLQLRNLFNNPSSIYRAGAFDEFLNGYTAEPTQTFDKFFSQELTNHLFEEHDTGFGMDLISLNLQRGREHGLPGYNEYRKVCGLKPINSFKELDQVMQKGSAQTFSKLYKSVDDIDLFIAGNHEKALPNAVVGPVFACILAEQSRRGKLGDRFWYENGDLPHSFSEKQLNEIRKSSLARLICDNSDKIESMQPLAFIQPIGWNKRIPCKQIAKVDLSLWKGERIWK